MKDPSNTWLAKLKRTLTAHLLPVAKERKGGCANCGACCKLPVRCLCLRYREDGSSYCAVHRWRPMNCRKYPRTRGEWITQAGCGYRFEDR